LISQESADQRTLQEVSEQIVNRVSLYFSEPLQTMPDTTIAPTPLPPSTYNGLPTSSQPLISALPQNSPVK
jgi:hypothetical protein